MDERMHNLVPIVIEQTGIGERSYDIYSRLLKDRIDPSVTDLPLLGTVAAGRPILAEENFSGFVRVPSEMTRPGTSFALSVRGDSMKDAGIFNGDIAVIEQSQIAENGEIDLDGAGAVFADAEVALFLQSLDVVVGSFDRNGKMFRHLADSRRVGVFFHIGGDEVENFALSVRQGLHRSVLSIPLIMRKVYSTVSGAAQVVRRPIPLRIPNRTGPGWPRPPGLRPRPP